MFCRDIETQEMPARVAQCGPKHADLFAIEELTGSAFALIRATARKGPYEPEQARGGANERPRIRSR